MLEEYKNQFTLEGHQYALRGKGNCYQELYPKNFEDAERILREKGKRFTLLPKALVKLEIESCGNWTLWTVVNPYHYPIEDLEDYTPEWEDYVKLYEDFVSSWGNGQVLEFKGLAIKKWCDNPSYRESQVLLIES